MEKLVYALWRPEPVSAADWSARLLEFGATELGRLGGERVKINLPDVPRPENDPYGFMKDGAPDAMVSFFVNGAYYRARLERAVASHAARLAGYSVLETTILPATSKADGTRSPGFTQICFFARRPDLTRAEMHDIWLDSHTVAAIETQCTFYYNQNVVVRKLTADAPDWDAIVEESYPWEALTDPEIYYRAKGDPELYANNVARMQASCARFIDFSGIKMLMSGEYRFGDWRDEAEPGLAA